MDYGEDYIVIDNNNIGFKIYTSNSSILEVKDSKDYVTFYTNLIHREDDMSIYGFLSKKELEVFKMLTTVSGVGAKLALGILSSMTYDKLISMIVAEDINGLTKAQGVGKKTAQRLILDMKDKVTKYHEINTETTILTRSHDLFEAVEALNSLGYGRIESENAVVKIREEGESIEITIKKALKLLAR